MAFLTLGELSDTVGPIYRQHVIANSTTVNHGDVVKSVSAIATLVTSSDTAVLGHVSGIFTAIGTPVLTDGTTGATFGSGSGVFTTAADNQTVAGVKVKVNLSKTTTYLADASATVSATTDLYAAAGLTDARTINVAGANKTHRVISASGTTKAGVMILNSQVF